MQVSGDMCAAGETILHETSLECCPAGESLKCPGQLCRKWITNGKKGQFMNSQKPSKVLNIYDLDEQSPTKVTD